MRKSIKAALLSGLVFPGAGHLFLKKHISGAVLACASLAAFYLIIANIIEKAQQITEKILQGEIALDVDAITELVSRQPSGNDPQLEIAWFVLIICWLIAIADSYRCGRAQDKSEVNCK